MFKLRTRMGKFDRNIGKKGPCLTCKIPGTEDSQEHHLKCMKTFMKEKRLQESNDRREIEWNRPY